MLLSRISLRTSILGNIGCRSRGAVTVMGNSNNTKPPPSSGNPSSRQQSADVSTKPKPPAPRPETHVKCCAKLYPRQSVIERFSTEGKVSWSIKYPEYNPTEYTAPNVACKPVWADKDFKNEGGTAAWNTLDGKVDRRSHTGPYEVVDGLPRNPVGRTGICGRGLLGRWGPNHAADPIVTRWKRTETGDISKENGKPVLQFIAIQRKDSGEWALPGGMVDPGERVSVTLKREFLEEALDVANMTQEIEQQCREQVNALFQGGNEGMVTPGEAVSLTLKREFSEETMNSLEVSEEKKQVIKEQVEEMFTQGTEVYRGYVDDPRNTDNSWMETVAVNFHDETGKSVGQFKLHAGDDAVGVQWSDMHGGLSLYASHLHFIRQVAQIHDSYW